MSLDDQRGSQSMIQSFSTGSRPAHGAGARGCGYKAGDTLLGWGGRLHG